MTAAASVKEPRDLICRDPRIEAPSVWVTAYRADLRELCQRHGEDSGTVNWAEYDLIDAPLLRFGVYLTDSEGSRYLACGHTPFDHDDDCRVAMRTVEHALIGNLPHWWQPRKAHR